MDADSPIRRPGTGHRPPGLRPLRRKPKQLDEDPTLFVPSSNGSGGTVFAADRTRSGRPAVNRPGSGAPGITQEDAELLEAMPSDATPDPEALRRAQQIAARLSIPRPRRDLTARRGTGELASVRYRGGGDDIDLDATLENLVEHPVPEDDDIIVRERLGTRRSVVLAVDISGSSRGERVRTAAATVGALAAELARDDLGVLAFWSDAVILTRLGQKLSPARLLEDLLRIPARGLTNVYFPLQLARQQLATVPARDARVLLLSDCVHNAGPDPRLAAAGLSRLDVLLDTSGEHDVEMARDLARLGHGKLAQIGDHRAVAPALSSFFDAGRTSARMFRHPVP